MIKTHSRYIHDEDPRFALSIDTSGIYKICTRPAEGEKRWRDGAGFVCCVWGFEVNAGKH